MATPEAESQVDTPATAPAEADDRGWRPYRLSVRQYLRMIAAGVFPPKTHVELLGGILVQQMTKGAPHDYALTALGQQFRSFLPAGWLIREDKSLQIGTRSRPEPDIAIVLGPLSLYRQRDPTARETALLVEVAESSYRYDRGRKWRRYAAAAVPVYWIVNFKKRQVEVYRDPAGVKDAAEYRTVEVYGEAAVVPVVIAGVEVGRVAVADILP